MERVFTVLKRRWKGAAAVLGILLAVLVYVCARPTADDAAAEPPQATAPPIMPAGYCSDKPWRDPFGSGGLPNAAALPAQEVVSQPAAGETVNKPVAHAAWEKVVQAKAVPHLKGIVASGGKQAAIIEYKGRSRSYVVGEAIADMRLVAIGDYTVTVVGDEGEVILWLGA